MAKALLSFASWAAQRVLPAGALLAAVLCGGAARAQSVGIGTTTPNPAAALDISSAGKGLLIPRLDSASRVAIASPPDGLMVFQTNFRKGFWYALGGTWVYIPNSISVPGDNLGNHQATQPLSFQTPDGDKVLLTSAGANGSKISHGAGWSFDSYAGPGQSGATQGQFRFLTTPVGGGYVERLRIAPGGNVGIGTSNPNYTLDVNGTANVTNGLSVDGVGLNTGLTRALRFGGGGSGEGIASNRPAGSVNRRGLDFYTNSLPRLSVAASGNVGIGTLAPGARLEVNGTAYVNAENSGFVVDANGARRVGLMKYAGHEGGLWRAGNTKFEIGRVNTTDLTVASSSNTFVTDFCVGNNGNVGIGNTAPQQRLDVSGSITANNIQLRDRAGLPGMLTAVNNDGFVVEPLVLSARGSLYAFQTTRFRFTHNLGRQPLVMVSVESLVFSNDALMLASYRHVNNNQIDIAVRNMDSNAAIQRDFVVKCVIVR